MRRITLILAQILLIWPTMAPAQEWRALVGDELREVLTDVRVTYPGGIWQVFYASGRTLYSAGQDNWGTWRVEGDQYCSQWPPSDLWSCYGIEVDGANLRFIGASGDIT